ncbi:pyridoxal-phosphate-dependent aminotransferase family protein [Caldalkalibacillus salinus]|uniref:pyridoxal-phosphate-dependent aminotransferase family protein n=1 Tax=Caldalkalibacillus salinus TaxID=2803787 RepID=UPI0019218DA3|nr:alanine--glyoxylate aminotransferase family protein [Caldalkalibacillus salinus]
MLQDHSILRIPGPTPIPPSVNQAMSQAMVGHRSEAFKHLLSRVAPRLKPIFGTNQDVLILTSSGTSALEAAVVNAVKEDDEVLVLVTGSFGDRFVKICEAYGIKVHRYDTTWGNAVQPEELKEVLQQHPQVSAVFATYCETSTGVLNPIEDLSKVIKQESDALFIVDGVSCVGAVEAQMDDWEIDILVTGSQKAFMLPTGLSFVGVSPRAWEAIENNPRPRFYLDLRKYQSQLEQNATPFTPGVSLIFGLEKVLDLLEAEGLDQVYRRHQTMKNMTRAACQALGLPLLTDDKAASPTVTAIKPETFAADDLRNVMRQSFSITLAGGQNHMKGHIFRIGHMGYCSPLDVLQCISALECALVELGDDITLGQGVAAAQEVYIHDLQNTR